MQILLIFLIFFISAHIHAESNKKADITVAIVVDSPLNEVGIKLVRELYAQAGLSTSFINLSAARSEHLQNKGDIDAELVRVEGLDRIPENMIKIPEPMLEVVISAYTINPQITDASPETLLNFRLGARHGLDLGNRLPGAQLTEVYRLKQLAYMLRHNRLDAIILSRMTSFFVIHKFGIKNLRELKPAIAKFQVHHYVHKRHEKLVPVITEILRKVKETGQTRRLIQQYMQAVLKEASAKKKTTTE